MQSIQPHVMPMKEQFLAQGNENPNNIGMGMPQMFSSQVNQNSIMVQQAGMLPNLQGMNNNQDQGNGYLMGQKAGPMISSQQELQGQGILNNQQGQDNQQRVQQQIGAQQQQQSFNINGPIGKNIPPGLNVMQQPSVGVNGPINIQLAKNLGGPAANSAGPMPPLFLPPPNYLFIRDVWTNNLHSEFIAIRRLATQYNYVSISTEFVGTLARPIGNFKSKEDYHYQTMRSNVDVFNPVQLGISLSDANGNKPDTEPSTWQFNFEFDTSKEMISAESLELLRKSGINFENHRTNGIDQFEFAQLMMDSGLLMDTNMTWITFHAAYDLGFLVNILMNDLMPASRQDFEWWVIKFMPNLYDLNLIYKIIWDFKNIQQPQGPQYTLTSLADDIGIPRFPIFTTTGGQSLLMLLSFCHLSKLSMNKFPDGTDFVKCKNIIYGINEEKTQ